MKTVDDFMSYIHPDVPDAPIGFIKQYIMEALQDISKVRGTMLEHLDPMILNAGDAYVVLPESFYYDEIICVKVDRIAVKRLPESCGPGNYCNWYLSGNDEQDGGDQLWIKGRSNSTKPRNVCVTVSYHEPQEDRVPDLIFRDWKLAVRRFVLWHMLEMPNRPWSAVQLASRHREQWAIERKKIKAQALLRLYGDDLRVRLPVNDFTAAGTGACYV